MKVKKAIEILSNMNPEAEIRLNDRNGFPLLFILALQNDNNTVWLECENDCDLGEELSVRFETAAEEQLDELDFYMDLLEIGINVATVRAYMGDEVAKHMELFCKEHGLI